MGNPFIGAYKKLLRRFNPLKDCTYINAQSGKRSERFRQSELEAFRRDRSLAYVERHVENCTFPIKVYRSAYTPTHDDLQNHFNAGMDTICMSNDGRSDELLMLADIDNKAGTGNAQAAAEHLAQKYFGGHAWIDISTFGKGRHVYFIMNVAYVKRAKVYEVFHAFEKLIAEDPVFAQLGCSFDAFYGLPTLWGKNAQGFEKIITRGNCLKLPYADTQAKLDALAGLRPLSFCVLENFLAAPPPTPPAVSTAYHILTNPPPLKKKRGWSLKADEVRSEPKPVQRMHGACTLFRNTYRRMPEDDTELVKFYEDNHFNTGADEKNRRVRRAGQVLDYQLKHTQSQTSIVLQYDAEKYTSLVKQFVTPEHRVGVKCDRPVTDADLGVGVYLLEMNSTTVSKRHRWQFTYGNQAIINMFRELKEAGLFPRACNFNQAVAIKNILVRAGLASEVNMEWNHLGKNHGVCKCYGLGPMHPRYEEFEQIRSNWETQKRPEPVEFMHKEETFEQTEVAEIPVLYEDFFDEEIGEKGPWQEIRGTQSNKQGSPSSCLEASPKTSVTRPRPQPSATAIGGSTSGQGSYARFDSCAGSLTG